MTYFLISIILLISSIADYYKTKGEKLNFSSLTFSIVSVLISILIIFEAINGKN